MHLLIVHHEAEIGLVLQKMIQEYTSHGVDCVTTDAAAFPITIVAVSEAEL